MMPNSNQAGDPSAVARTKKVVLIIEDDEDFFPLVQMMLADDALEIVSAPTGKDGLEAIRSLRPDVVIIDLMLPDMNGWEVFVQMREEIASRDTPVIILTAQGTRHDRSFGLQVAKVHDYLLKPCLPSQLRQSVASALAS